MNIPDSWTPTAANINALPDPIRSYIHQLHSDCDPAGTVQQNVLQRDMLAQANAMIARLKAEAQTKIPKPFKAYATFEDATGDLDGEVENHLGDDPYARMLPGFTVYEVLVTPVAVIPRDAR